MKKLVDEKDYLCIMGKPSDITANLNKIAKLYDFKILTSAVKEEGILMVILERRQKKSSKKKG